MCLSPGVLSRGTRTIRRYFLAISRRVIGPRSTKPLPQRWLQPAAAPVLVAPEDVAAAIAAPPDPRAVARRVALRDQAAVTAAVARRAEAVATARVVTGHAATERVVAPGVHVADLFAVLPAPCAVVTIAVRAGRAVAAPDAALQARRVATVHVARVRAVTARVVLRGAAVVTARVVTGRVAVGLVAPLERRVVTMLAAKVPVVRASVVQAENRVVAMFAARACAVAVCAAREARPAAAGSVAGRVIAVVSGSVVVAPAVTGRAADQVTRAVGTLVVARARLAVTLPPGYAAQRGRPAAMECAVMVRAATTIAVRRMTPAAETSAALPV